MRLTERLKAALSLANLTLEGQSIAVTASFGVDIYRAREHLSLGDFIKRADSLLLEAKAQGRDTIVHGESEALSPATEITLAERKRIFPSLKRYGEQSASNYADETVLPDQR